MRIWPICAGMLIVKLVCIFLASRVTYFTRSVLLCIVCLTASLQVQRTQSRCILTSCACHQYACTGFRLPKLKFRSVAGLSMAYRSRMMAAVLMRWFCFVKIIPNAHSQFALLLHGSDHDATRLVRMMHAERSELRTKETFPPT